MNTDTDQLDNPTEWESLIGAAIVDPARTAEMKRKVDLKLAVERRIFCECGSILDQQNAVCLVDKTGSVRNVSCPACMKTELRKSLQKMTERYGAEHTQETITQEFTVINWAGTTTGKEIWETYSRHGRRPKKDSHWYTPAELEKSCIGWTPGAIVAVEPRFILRPNAAGRRKLEKRAPNGLQNHDRFPRLLAQAEEWFCMSEGARLTEVPTTTPDDDGRPQTEMKYSDGSHCCDMGTKIVRTVEHYCGAGYWTESPTDMFIVYRTPSGTPSGLAARMIDRSER